MKQYKLMTFNIQSCKNYITKEFDHTVCSKVIKEENPDILSLNEVRTAPIVETTHKSWFPQTENISEYTGLSNYYFGRSITLEGYYGNSILSKYIIENPIVYNVKDALSHEEKVFYESRSMMVSKIDGINVIITHMGLANEERENAVELLLNILNTLTGPIVLMGDFNMQPDNKLIKVISSKLKSVDSYIKEPLLTYPSINPTMKIDYIFVSNDIEIIDAHIITKVASDHYPVVANIIVK